MNNFISISSKGSITVHGVYIGMKEDDALQNISSFQVRIIPPIIACSNVVVEDFLPTVNIRVYIDTLTKRTCQIKIWRHCKDKGECDALFNYFNNTLCKFDLFVDDCKDYTMHKKFTNSLHFIRLHRQYGYEATNIDGYTVKNEDACPFYLDVQSHLFTMDSVDELRNKFSYLYVPDHINKKYANRQKCISMNYFLILKRIFISFITIVFFVILYLFALNGRYYVLYNDTVVFDKWNKTCKEFVDYDRAGIQP